jgi:hypothetical protein
MRDSVPEAGPDRCAIWLGEKQGWDFRVQDLLSNFEIIK